MSFEIRVLKQKETNSIAWKIAGKVRKLLDLFLQRFLIMYCDILYVKAIKI